MPTYEYTQRLVSASPAAGTAVLRTAGRGAAVLANWPVGVSGRAEDEALKIPSACRGMTSVVSQ